jgi:hypothetical protein
MPPDGVANRFTIAPSPAQYCRNLSAVNAFATIVPERCTAQAVDRARLRTVPDDGDTEMPEALLADLLAQRDPFNVLLLPR